MAIIDLFKNFQLAYSEINMLKNLSKSAQDRLDAAFKRILVLFKNSEEDVIREISYEDIVKLSKGDFGSCLFWVPGANEHREHPLDAVINYTAEQYPEMLSLPSVVIFLIYIAENFSNTDLLLQDINKVKHQYPDIEFHFIVKRDLKIIDNCLKGGFAIKYELTREDVSEKDFQLDGVSSNDMAGFVRKIIEIYVKRHPGITLTQLQKDLRELHEGSKWSFVEEKKKIQRLVENGKRVTYTLSEPGRLEDGTEYVVYGNLYRRTHLPLIIEFAKAHNIL